MVRELMKTPDTPLQADAGPHAEAIWCIHYECYKQLKVCDRCRVRIKCARYQDYWSPPFDFGPPAG